MDVTQPYEFTGFGAMDVTQPYEFTGFGAMDVTKPIGALLHCWSHAVDRRPASLDARSASSKRQLSNRGRGPYSRGLQ